MKKLTVAEYAELKCISVQAVYKKINKLKTTEEERNGRKITLIIIDDEEPKPKEEEIKPISTDNSTSTATDLTPEDKVTSTSNSTSTASTSTPDIKPTSTDNSTSNIIEVLKTQLQEKDKQIERLQDTVAEKDKQLKEQFDKFAELLYRQQQLEAITQHKLLKSGEAEEEITEPEEKADDLQPEEAQDQEQTQKKGFFSRLFKRKRASS